MFKNVGETEEHNAMMIRIIVELEGVLYPQPLFMQPLSV